MEAYRLTRKEGAPGIDGVTAEDYEANARSLNIELQAAAPPWERGRSAAGASHRRRRTSGRRLLLVLRVGRRRWTWQAATNRMPMAQAWVRVTKRAIHHEVRMRSKRQCKTGAIQLRTTATRTIKRHALNRTVNRQSSGAILAELKHRLSEIYDLTAAGSVLTWDEATYMPKGGTVARGRQSSLLRRLAHERFVDPALGRLIDRLEPGTRQASRRRRQPDPHREARLRKSHQGPGRVRCARECAWFGIL